MFSAPERVVSVNGESYFKVNLLFPKLLGTQFILMSPSSKLEINEAAIQLFGDMQSTVLTELMHNKQLFKNAPTKQSLETITPKWGVILFEGKPQWSPYTTIQIPADFSKREFPARVDLSLKSLHISRTSIKPVFETVYVGSVQESNVIDFDWDAVPSAAEELSEVSDIAAMEGDADCIELRDPASIRQKRAQAKQTVRELFNQANEMRTCADDAAAKFYEEFDLSDGESAFSEWQSDNDDETDEDSA